MDGLRSNFRVIRRIEPQDIKRVSREEMICPDCGNRCDAKKARASAQSRATFADPVCVGSVV
jgi:hypothetical protein